MKKVFVALFVLKAFVIFTVLGFAGFGVYSAFSASILLGLLSFIPPMSLVLGVVSVFKPEVCEQISQYLNLPF